MRDLSDARAAEYTAQIRNLEESLRGSEAHSDNLQEQISRLSNEKNDFKSNVASMKSGVNSLKEAFSLTKLQLERELAAGKETLQRYTFDLGILANTLVFRASLQKYALVLG